MRARTRALLAAAVALAVAALGVAGCGEKAKPVAGGPPERLELMLDFFPNADHAGIYAADASGHFGDAGLEVAIRQPADPALRNKQVAAGRVDLAVSYEPEVLRARDEGLSVVSVAALVQRPLTSIISLPRAKIRSPEDLAGKRIGTAGIDYQSAFLRTILEQAGVDPASVRQRNVGFNLSPALLTRRVDAVLGAFWNYEGVDLRLRGRDPRVIRVDEAGVPSYDELVIVANADSLERDRGRIRRFLGALSRGTEDLERDADAALRGLLRANRDLDPRLQREVVKVTLPLCLPPRGRPYGWHEPQEWRRFAAWMRQNRLLRREPAPDAAFTNALLPGQGP